MRSQREQLRSEQRGHGLHWKRSITRGPRGVKRHDTLHFLVKLKFSGQISLALNTTLYSALYNAIPLNIRASPSLMLLNPV